MAEIFKYRAFLSYCHADTRFAKRVHGRLENFQIDKDLVGRMTSQGPIPASVRPIFRDRHDFDAGGSLAEQTTAALDGSSALIILASPHAARSKFVNEEVRQFKLRHPDRLIIPLIVGGEPGDPEMECFPPALRHTLTSDGTISNTSVDVLAADLREKGDGLELALAKVIARIIGLTPDDVYRRAERERRRKARQRWWVQLLIYVLLLGIIGGLIGWINQAYIEEQITWFTRMRPYMLANVRPYLLSPDAEQTLRPFASFRECAKDCPEMVVMPPGTFTMGSPANETGRSKNEGPERKVGIARSFAVSKFDVTFADWDACVSVGGCPQASSSNFGRAANMPVINVSWEDAQLYVAWFSKMTGRSYRLPTEAQWEYAARAGKKATYPWGVEIGNGNANCNGCGSTWDNNGPSPVGSFKPNDFGLYDMAGDVWQWVQDCYHDDYSGAPIDGSVWIGGDCSRHLVRGGSWYDGPLTVRSAYRVGDATVNRNSSLGFRIVRTLTP